MVYVQKECVAAPEGKCYVNCWCVEYFGTNYTLCFNLLRGKNDFYSYAKTLDAHNGELLNERREATKMMKEQK